MSQKLFVNEKIRGKDERAFDTKFTVFYENVLITLRHVSAKTA